MRIWARLWGICPSKRWRGCRIDGRFPTNYYDFISNWNFAPKLKVPEVHDEHWNGRTYFANFIYRSLFVSVWIDDAHKLVQRTRGSECSLIFLGIKAFQKNGRFPGGVVENGRFACVLLAPQIGPISKIGPIFDWNY